MKYTLYFKGYGFRCQTKQSATQEYNNIYYYNLDKNQLINFKKLYNIIKHGFIRLITALFRSGQLIQVYPVRAFDDTFPLIYLFIFF